MPIYLARVQYYSEVTYQWEDIPEANLSITGDGEIQVSIDEPAQVGVGTVTDHILLEEEV